ncbi:MAG: DNA translocase FtsK, partial [Candidatus Hydrogenedentota bacterium]
GPTVTQFEVQVTPGTKLSNLTARSGEIAYAMACSSVRIEAPIPGKTAIGIEIPNKEKITVNLRELIDKDEFRKNEGKLFFTLGKSINGIPQYANLEQMPHLLIAGATGSGKSVCIHTIIMSILYRARPDEVKMVLIDPKMVELKIYNGIPHLVHPVVTDPRKAARALKWAVNEMDSRYRLFAEVGARDIRSYNLMEKPKTIRRIDGTELDVRSKLPYIVVIVDELADLMVVSSKDCEDAVMRLSQMARAVGIHLVLATQRPSVDVVTGVIKANLPYRIAFSVLSKVDSRTILDRDGADKLLGLGDMLYLAGDRPQAIRIQGAYISPQEVQRIIDFITDQGFGQTTEDIFVSKLTDPNENVVLDDDLGDDEELFEDAFALCKQAGYASTSLIQRRLRIGYNRAARLVDIMEARGLIGPADGARPRKILISSEKETNF